MHWEHVSSSALLNTSQHPEGGSYYRPHQLHLSPYNDCQQFQHDQLLRKTQHIVRTLLWFSVLFWLKCVWREKEGEEKRGKKREGRRREKANRKHFFSASGREEKNCKFIVLCDLQVTHIISLAVQARDWWKSETVVFWVLFFANISLSGQYLDMASP